MRHYRPKVSEVSVWQLNGCKIYSRWPGVAYNAGGLVNGVLVQYEDLKMCAYNMYLPAVHLNSNTGKIKSKENIMQKWVYLFIILFL